VALIGGGNMGLALARGLVASGALAPERLIASDPSAERIARIKADVGARVTVARSNADAFRAADTVVLCVKPCDLARVLEEVGPLSSADPARRLIVSVVAGADVATLVRAVGPRARIARAMPNAPCAVGEGASVFTLGACATDADAATVAALLGSMGAAFQVPERLMDAATGLSGSGPAYVAQFVEALADGGVRAGLSREVASALALRTVLGTARVLIETAEHPAALKDRVASPGGTTIAGLHALERGGLRAAVIDAVVAAAERSAVLFAARAPSR
jgi:pyrroline-5-carboxylate reductase